jgi:hypothetical protein
MLLPTMRKDANGPQSAHNKLFSLSASLFVRLAKPCVCSLPPAPIELRDNSQALPNTAYQILQESNTVTEEHRASA